MAFKNIIWVSEFEKLYYDEGKPFQQKHWEALCRYLESVNKKPGLRVEYYRILNKGIQFTNYVGVIQAGNLTIEVLPKIDKDATTAANRLVSERMDVEAEKQARWHGALLQMLKECRLLRVAHVDYASLNLRSNSILEIYLELFLSETEALLHEGLLKKYRKQEGNQTALKGQLQFAKQLAYNSTHGERFYVRYTEYNRDNLYNQLLYKTLRLIPKVTNSHPVLDRVGRLLLDFPEVSPCVANEETFNRLTFDRKTERYKEALLIARMLLLNYRPDITGGAENVIAILFDMNKLWEEWVYRRLKREEDDFGVTVQRQQSKSFWQSDQSRTKIIRPDIVIKNNSTQQTIVVDTKWKLMEDFIPSDEDLKQMYVYNLFWNCNRSVLLYPAASAQFVNGDYFDYQDPENLLTGCRVQTVSVLDRDGRLDKTFGYALLETILS